MTVWQNVQPVSVESRLNRIYPQTEARGIVPFIWQVSSSNQFYVASASGVYIRSSITEGIE